MTQGDVARAADGGSPRDRIHAFLGAHTTITLATYSVETGLAAAAVFYAVDERLNLYFLSEERTEHGRNLLVNDQVAGTIQDDGQDWRAIKGLQLRGTARVVTASEFPRAAAIYGRRFAFVGVLLAGQAGSVALAGPLAKARFWVLRPSWLRLTDNTVQFGHKEELRPDETL